MKSICYPSSIYNIGSPPARVVWVEIITVTGEPPYQKSPPARVVWVEISLGKFLMDNAGSPPARVVWVEITVHVDNFTNTPVTTREGGVG